MTLRVVGAGVGRTGTNSLKLALERLLGAPCYHMLEVFEHLDHVPMWQQAADGEPVDWDAFFAGFAAAVDWPASASWAELAAAYPDAIVVLSTRSDPQTWWRSMEQTVLRASQNPMAADVPPGHPMAGWTRMMQSLMTNRFCADPADPAAMIAAYERHNAAVRAAVPAARWCTGSPVMDGSPSVPAFGYPCRTSPFRTSTRRPSSTHGSSRASREARPARLAEPRPARCAAPPTAHDGRRPPPSCWRSRSSPTAPTSRSRAA